MKHLTNFFILSLGLLFIVAACDLAPVKDSDNNNGGIELTITATEAAQIASSFGDYVSQEAYAEASNEDVNDMDNDDADAIAAGISSSRATIKTVPTKTKTLSDGTVVTIDKTLDDNYDPNDPDQDPDDPTDDVWTIVRTYDYGDNEKVETVIRERKPNATGKKWVAFWENLGTDTYTPDTPATSETKINNVVIKTSENTITYKKISVVENGETVDKVIVSKIVKNEQHIGRNGNFNKSTVTVEYDEDNENAVKSKSQARIVVKNNEEVEVHQFTYVYLEEDGINKIKIIRDDGRYTISYKAEEDGETVRYREHYVVDEEDFEDVEDLIDEEGTLRMIAKETGNKASGSVSVTKDFYEDDGVTIKRSVDISITFTFNDDGSTTIDKEFSNGKTMAVSILPIENGYTITRTVNDNTLAYSVVFDKENNSVTITIGTKTAAVVFNDDGSYTVTIDEGDAEEIELD